MLAWNFFKKDFSRTEICGLHPLVPLIWTVTFKYMQDFPGISLQGELNCDNKRVQTLSFYVKQILSSSPLAPGGCQRAAEVWGSACLQAGAGLPSLSDRPDWVSPFLLDTGRTTEDTPDPRTVPLPQPPTSHTEPSPNHDPLQPPATEETLQRETHTMKIWPTWSEKKAENSLNCFCFKTQIYIECTVLKMSWNVLILL